MLKLSKSLSIAVLSASLIASSLSANAGSATGNVQVNGTVASNCSVSNEKVDFGTISTATTSKDVTITINCDKDVSWTLGATSGSFKLGNDTHYAVLYESNKKDSVQKKNITGKGTGKDDAIKLSVLVGFAWADPGNSQESFQNFTQAGTFSTTINTSLKF